jgi:hypothetical protein
MPHSPSSRRAGELPEGFAGAVRAWLLVLLGGDARARPRSHTSIYACSAAVRPLIEQWAADRGHLREVTADIKAGPLHLALVFGLSRTTAGKYTLIACDLLAEPAR